MTRIDELLRDGPTISFEFFPPKTELGRQQLRDCVDQLGVLDPSFVSVTYGAGGSTRDATSSIVAELQAAHAYPVMPHLTCIGHTTADVDALLDDYERAGIENILALAGDPPADGSTPRGDFSYASELVEVIRSRGVFGIGVAAFPEGHPRSVSLAEDRRRLAAKLESADFALSQFFYRIDDFLRLRDDLADLGCDRPVIPGVMPLVNPEAVRRFASINGAWFPEELAARVEAADPDDRVAVAAEAAVDMCRALIAEGVPGLHVYALNRSQPALAILQASVPTSFR